jgi:hypothetical protein
MVPYCLILPHLSEEFGEVWPSVSSVYTNPRELARDKSFIGICILTPEQGIGS